jgi:hypothetical protein
LVFFSSSSPPSLPLFCFFLWLMGRSPSVRRLSDKLHSCIARGFLSHLHTLRVALCISAIKRFGSDQALEVRDIQPGDASDHPFHGIAADRKISQPSLSFMSDSSGVRVLLSPRSPGISPPSPFPNGYYLPGLLRSPSISDLILHQRGGQAGKGEKGRGEQKDSIFRVRP